MRQEQGRLPGARSRQRGLRTGMAAANDDDIEFDRMEHENRQKNAQDERTRFYAEIRGREQVCALLPLWDSCGVGFTWNLKGLRFHVKHRDLRSSASRGAGQAQVTFDDTRVMDQLASRTFERNFPGFEDVGVVRNLQGGARVLLDQQNRGSGLAQARDDLKYLAHDERSQTKAGFVQHQQLWPAHERPP